MGQKQYQVGTAQIRRVRAGVPSILAPNRLEAMRAIGFAHAIDRGAQMEVARLMAAGRSAELWRGDPGTVRADRFSRRMGIHLDPQRDIELLSPDARRWLQAYADGVTRGFKSRRGVNTLRLFLSHRPRDWVVADTVLIWRLFSLLSAVSIQVPLERGVLSLLRQGLPVSQLGELFGLGLGEVDHELIASLSPLADEFDQIPGGLGGPLLASNAWAVGPDRSASKSALIAGDPHTDISRLPAWWYEIEVHTPVQGLAGATIPGVPFILMGRSRDLAWAVASAPVDTVDYVVESCRAGQRRTPNGWEPFRVREEVVRVRGGRDEQFVVFESDNGVLEGNPESTGNYLSLRWVGRPGAFAGSLEALVGLPRAQNVDQARELLKGWTTPALEFVLADTEGNIAVQTAGLVPVRRKGESGLLPACGWHEEPVWDGFVDATDLPGESNPASGFVIAANRVRTGPHAELYSCATADERFERLSAQLRSTTDWNVADFQQLQYDVVSPLAEQLLPVFLPHVGSDEDRRALERWSGSFHVESREARLFHSMYQAALMVVFGDGGIGRSYLSYLLGETTFLLGAAGGMHRVMLNPSSDWFTDRDYNICMRQAVREGLAAQRGTWGEHNQTTLHSPMVDRRVPRLVRLRKGPYPVGGHLTTVHMALEVKNHGVQSFLAPSFRLVSDLNSSGLWTNHPAGPSENPLSRRYVNGFNAWRYGDYKRLRVKRR